MNTETKTFIFILFVALVLLLGVIFQNAVSINQSKVLRVQVDVEKVKQEIEGAGLKPVDAKYWKVVN